MNVTVASRNPIKIAATQAAFERFRPEWDVRVRAVDIDTGTPEQPIGAEIEAGAVARATAAATLEGADLGVGIEAGLIQLPGSGRWISVQVCAIVDRAGKCSIGLGPGYELPADIREAVRDGEPLREAFCRLLGVEDAERLGAVAAVTGGRIDRRALTEQAVLMALASQIGSADS